MSFVLIDESQGATTGDGSALTPAKLSQIASAMQTYLNRDVAAEHGGGPFLVRVGVSSDIQPGDIVFAILPALPQAPGAVAYHDVNGNGVAVAFDAISASSTLTGPGNSLSVAISHELAEIVGDEGCNLWADRGDLEVAHELCDPVEVQTYEVDATGVFVSNFVLRSYFDPSRAGPWDWMTSRGIAGAVSPTGPMQLAPGNGGNYMITRHDGAGEGQVTGMGSPTVTVSVSFPFGMRRPWRHGSRRQRRGVTA